MFELKPIHQDSIEQALEKAHHYRVLNEPGDRLDNAIRANIEMGVEQLRTAKPDLAAAVGSGQLTVAGGYYDLASGEVSLL